MEETLYLYIIASEYATAQLRLTLREHQPHPVGLATLIHQVPASLSLNRRWTAYLTDDENVHSLSTTSIVVFFDIVIVVIDIVIIDILLLSLPCSSGTSIFIFYVIGFSSF